jgi:hypothetical protein
VGGYTDTSISSKNGTTFGSWVEYAIFAVGNIKQTGSGAAFAQTGLATTGGTNFPCKYSTLSFANIPASPANGTTCTGVTGTIGNYSNVLSPSPAQDIGDRFPTNSSTPALPRADLTGLQGVYTANGPVTISGGNIGGSAAPGEWIVINAPNQDVTITGNINYTSKTLHTISEIPQVVIIAGDITISDASATKVTNIDAWLIAKKNNIKPGNIYTCETDPKSVSDCPDTLLVNGPVIANKLFLRRTGGTDSGSAAETFNLRADAYLWAYGLASGAGKIQTVHTAELPPRY